MPDTNDMGERIAFRSTRGEGRFQKPRWTEIAVYHQPRVASEPPVWHATVTGCSSIEGETARVQSYRNGKLGLLLANAFGSDRSTWTGPVRSVMEQVGVWLENNRDRMERDVPTYNEKQLADATAILTGTSHLFEADDARGTVIAIAAALGMERQMARG